MSKSPEKARGNQKPMSRQAAYNAASSRFMKALDVIDESLNAKHPAVKFGAAKLVWETVLPQKAIIELMGEEGGPIKHTLDDSKIIELINDKLKKLSVT